ncbi:hypothetical protein ACLOJK_006542 [Asimina triloba]
MGTRRAVRDGNSSLEGRIYERTAREGLCARRDLRPERYVQELLGCLDRCRLDALIGVDDDPCLIGADNDPCSRQGSEGRGGAYLRQRLFGNSPLHYRCGYEVRSWIRMSGKQLITPKDLNVIWEDYSIPSNIVLLAPTAHETPRDNRTGYLCLNEYI